MFYTYKIGISAEEHDSFVKQSPQANLLQSSQWATVKSEWRNERLGFFKDGKLVAVASLLIRRLVVPFGFTMIYIPRGPVMDYEDAELVSFVFKSIKEFALRERSVVIKFDPFIRLSSKTITGDREEELNVLAVKDRIVDLGGIWSGRVQTMSATIQPTYHAVLYSESFSEESLNKRVRQNIRSARNKGIEIRIGREELLRDFSELLKKTEERKSIRLRGREYYQKILNAYPENSYIVVAYLDLAKRYEQLSYLEEKLVKEAMTFTSTTRQSKIENYKKETRRINTELEMINFLIRNGSKLVPLAGTLTIDFAGTSENIYAGMDEKELSAFKQIIEETGARQGFEDRDSGYYNSLFESFGTQADFLVAELDPKVSLKQIEKEIETSARNSKQYAQQVQKLLTKQEVVQNILNQTQTAPIFLACALIIYDVNEATYLFGGSYSEFQSLSAPFLLQYEAMQRAIKRNLKRYNFLGIQGIFDSSDGVLRFKQNFNGYILRKAGTFRYYPHPIKHKII
ncbi:TPA: peptidoglycan bridge formation glycyltransferase FemA/FemB family protein, partial [Streptococcus suis]